MRRQFSESDVALPGITRGSATIASMGVGPVGLAEVVAQLAVEYEARPEPDAMENSALLRLDSESDNYASFAVTG